MTGELSPDEREIVASWLAADPDLRLKLDALRRTQLQSSRHLPASSRERMLDGIFAADPAPEAPVEVPLQRRNYRTVLWSALLLVLAGAGAWWGLLGRNEAAEWSIVRAKAGSHSSITLPDGTEVILNAGSELSYPTDFRKDHRMAKLKGEGYFKVKSDPEHPFVISTSLVDVRVLGTEFNLRAWPNESTTETALISGAVEVVVKNEKMERIVLKPRQKVSVDKRFITSMTEDDNGNRSGLDSGAASKAIRIQPLDADEANITQETAWLNHKLVFKNQPFGELAAAIERSYGVTVIFRNDSLRSVNFSGIIKDESLHELMGILKTMKDFNYRIDSNTVTIE